MTSALASRKLRLCLIGISPFLAPLLIEPSGLDERFGRAWCSLGYRNRRRFGPTVRRRAPGDVLTNGGTDQGEVSAYLSRLASRGMDRLSSCQPISYGLNR
jgi:hypothetical protein